MGKAFGAMAWPADRRRSEGAARQSCETATLIAAPSQASRAERSWVGAGRTSGWHPRWAVVAHRHIRAASTSIGAGPIAGRSSTPPRGRPGQTTEAAHGMEA